MAEAGLQTERILSGLLRDRPDAVVEIALAARKAVLKAAGRCSELIYETYCISNAFTFTGKQGQGFIHIATYAAHVNLGFDHGTALADPGGLLQGTGKRIRHIRLDSPADLKQPAITQLIVQAVQQGRELAAKKGGVAQPQVVVKRRTK